MPKRIYAVCPCGTDVPIDLAIPVGSLHCCSTDCAEQYRMPAASVVNSLNLPAGKTCGDCAHFSRCEWLIQCKPTNTDCDFDPVRFRQKESAAQ